MDDLLYSNPAYRLARITEMLGAGQQKIVPMTAGVAQTILPANTRRVSFTLGLAQGSGLVIWPAGTAVSGQGFLIDPTQQPRTFSVEADGPWVQQAISAVAAGAIISLAVIETALIDGEFDPSKPLYLPGKTSGANQG